MSSFPRFRARSALLALILVASASAPAHALRIVNWNILNYPGTSGAVRDSNYRTVLGPIGADVVVTEEMTSQAGVTEFLTSVLNTMEPGQWAAAPFVDGNDTDAGLFYKPAKVQFLGQWAFYPSATHLRYIHVYRIAPVGYTSASAELRLYAGHLKASQGFETDRLNEAIGIRDSMNAMPPGTHAVVCGDFNVYTYTEGAYQKFLESQANNVGRVYDPLPAGAWHDGASFARIHTQSTCVTGCLYGEATGGMDDRFDFILPTLNLGTGQGLALVDSIVAVGQDGQHFNKGITDSPTIPQGAAYASALIGTSDHLPIRMDLQLPAQIAGPVPLAFPTVIAGAPNPVQGVLVSNAASAPADSLRFSFSADPGFVAPAGPFALAPAAAAVYDITMDAAAPGIRAGLLHVASNDADHPVTDVSLGGTVLRHAVASLDSLAVRDTLTLNFGYAEAGGFASLDVRVHDAGWDPLQARLAVGAANVTGGDGRFSIAGFSPVVLGGVGQSWSVAFDDAGATTDSTYTATLTFSSADEPLAGATARPDLAVTLLATVKPGVVTGVGGLGAPAATRLYAPRPNPLVGGTTVRFDLARAGDVRLEAYDALGRRVATLARGPLEPGRYSVRWDGRGTGGAPARPGLYFVRLTGRGIGQQTVRLAVLR